MKSICENKGFISPCQASIPEINADIRLLLSSEMKHEKLQQICAGKNLFTKNT